LNSRLGEGSRIGGVGCWLVVGMVVMKMVIEGPENVLKAGMCRREHTTLLFLRTLNYLEYNL
jgi:hypothetical protein